jgi:hypothetical protein
MPIVYIVFRTKRYPLCCISGVRQQGLVLHGVLTGPRTLWDLLGKKHQHKKHQHREKKHQHQRSSKPRTPPPAVLDGNEGVVTPVPIARLHSFARDGGPSRTYAPRAPNFPERRHGKLGRYGRVRSTIEISWRDG